jgi:heme/copper-type cytochrome/quinol oxidase subunit 1
VPPLTRRYLATAAVFLLVGVALGLWLLIRRELAGRWPEPGLVSAHTHLILVGAVMELIIGVAWWFFPRPLRRDPPASIAAVTLAWWLLTLGTAARAVGESAAALSAGTSWAPAVVAGGVLQVVGLAAAVVALRRRVRPGRPADG